jgi:hypothetical protein
MYAWHGSARHDDARYDRDGKSKAEFDRAGTGCGFSLTSFRQVAPLLWSIVAAWSYPAFNFPCDRPLKKRRVLK